MIRKINLKVVATQEVVYTNVSMYPIRRSESWIRIMQLTVYGSLSVMTFLFLKIYFAEVFSTHFTKRLNKIQLSSNKNVLMIIFDFFHRVKNFKNEKFKLISYM